MIRLINGKTGKPIKDEELNVFLNGSRFSELQRADRTTGLIRMTIDKNAYFSVMSNIPVTCNPYTSVEHELRKYKVADVLAYGFSDENQCNRKVHLKPNPGEFIFYERPRTLWEWMAL